MKLESVNGEQLDEKARQRFAELGVAFISPDVAQTDEELVRRAIVLHQWGIDRLKQGVDVFPAEMMENEQFVASEIERRQRMIASLSELGRIDPADHHSRVDWAKYDKSDRNA